jgi:hypothetical protein
MTPGRRRFARLGHNGKRGAERIVWWREAYYVCAGIMIRIYPPGSHAPLLWCLLCSAGKSTTISMLTGLTPATEGDAIVRGKSLRRDMAGIRQSMGVCPQHDTLWGELSVAQHLQLVAAIKGVPRGEVRGAGGWGEPGAGLCRSASPIRHASLCVCFKGQ